MTSSAGGPPPIARREKDVTPGSSAGTTDFAELVFAHSLVVRSRDDDAAQEEADRRYSVALAGFERAYGRITDAYWAKDGRSAAVLTEGRREALGDLLRRETPPKLHVQQAPSRSPRASDLQYQCLALAVRASVVLRSTSRRVAMGLVFNIVARVLGMAGTSSANAEHVRPEQAFGQLEGELRHAQEYVKSASDKYARLCYAQGMAVSLLAVAIVAVVADVAAGWTRTSERLTVMAAAGACGAVVSVLQRFSGGRLWLPADLDRRQLFGAGASRAVIGAVFGAAVYFLFTAKVVVVLPETSARIPVYALTGFLAGFAERWVSILYAELAPFGAEEVAERIPVAVDESVRAALFGPALARWHGFVSLSIDAPETDEGVPRLEPLEPTDLTIRFGQEETGDPLERPIDVRDGEDAPEVTFTLRLDSDTVSTPASEQSLVVPANGGGELNVSFAAPKASGRHQVWLRVSQRNRVVQMVPFELEVGD